MVQLENWQTLRQTSSANTLEGLIKQWQINARYEYVPRMRLCAIFSVPKPRQIPGQINSRMLQKVAFCGYFRFHPTHVYLVYVFDKRSIITCNINQI